MPTTRRRTTSESQYLSSQNDSAAHGVCSPLKPVSPEFVNTIAMNPGGQPKEVYHLILTFHLTLYCFEQVIVKWFSVISPYIAQ